MSAFARALRAAYKLSGAKKPFPCRRADVPCSAFARPGMVHCYCMLPYFREAKEDFAKITNILKK